MAAPYSPSNPRPGTQWNVVSDYTGSFVAPSTYLLQPEIRAQIFDAYKENTIYDTLIHSGRTKVSKNTTFRHFEHDSYFHVHTIESFTGSGAGVAIVVTLEEIDHLQTGTLSEPKVKDLVIVYTATGPVKGYITAVNKASASAHVITIDPINDATDLGTATANGNRIGIYSSAASDGAGMTDATSRLPVDFYNYVQIVDTKKQMDEGEAANESFVTVDGKKYYYHQLIVDGDFEQRMKIDNAFIFGERNASHVDPVTGKTVYMTGGLEWWADNEGYAEPYSTTFGDGDLQNVARNLNLERAPKKQWLLVGNELNMNLESLMNTAVTNTAINWAAMGMGSAADRLLDFGIQGFTKYNYTFMKQSMDVFNYIGLSGGFSTSPYPYMGFSVSWDRFRDAKGDDTDTVCLRYKANDRGSRLNKFWERDHKITSNDQADFNWKGEVGIQIGLARHINKIYKA